MSINDEIFLKNQDIEVVESLFMREKLMKK
jgi:hypothetical protein